MKELMKATFDGQLKHDFELFAQLERRIRDTSLPMDERRQALTKYNSGMRRHGGNEPLYVSPDDVRNFIGFN